MRARPARLHCRNRTDHIFNSWSLTLRKSFGADDKVVLRWPAHMTHLGNTLGVPATGKPVRLTGITIARIVNGQIVAGWDNWDQLGMLQQIGAYGQRGGVALGKPA